MKIEWFVTNVTAVGFPDRSEHALLDFGGDFGLTILLANSGQCLWPGSHFVM